MGAQWEFVVSQPNNGPDAQTKKTVRKAAMRAFRRNQRMERMQQFQKRQAGSSPESDESSKGKQQKTPATYVKVESGTSFPLPAEAAAAAAAPRQLDNAAGFAMSDVPFSPFEESKRRDTIYPEPVPTTQLSDGLDLALGASPSLNRGNSNYYELFRHFLSVVFPQLDPLSNKGKSHLSTEWSYQALMDPVVFESTLFHSGVHLDQAHNRPWSASTLYHRGQTIRLLNERLSSGENSPDDSTIAAAGLFAASNNVTGNADEDLVHNKVMAKMISQRGGLENLGWNGALAWLLSTANILNPGVPPSQYLDSPSLQDQGKVILDSIHALSDLALILSKLGNNPSTTLEDCIPFHRQCWEIEHRLLSMRIPLPTGGTSADAYMFEAARLATLLCTHHTFPPSPSSSPLSLSSSPPTFQTNLTSLTTTLSQIYDLQVLCQPAPLQQRDVEMMLWVGFVAGIFSPPAQKPWFGQMLSSAIVFLGLESAQRVRGVLAGYFWTQRMQGWDECVGFWQGP